MDLGRLMYRCQSAGESEDGLKCFGPRMFVGVFTRIKPGRVLSSPTQTVVVLVVVTSEQGSGDTRPVWR